MKKKVVRKDKRTQTKRNVKKRQSTSFLPTEIDLENYCIGTNNLGRLLEIQPKSILNYFSKGIITKLDNDKIHITEITKIVRHRLTDTKTILHHNPNLKVVESDDARERNYELKNKLLQLDIDERESRYMDTEFVHDFIISFLVELKSSFNSARSNLKQKIKKSGPIGESEVEHAFDLLVDKVVQAYHDTETKFKSFCE